MPEINPKLYEIRFYYSADVMELSLDESEIGLIISAMNKGSTFLQIGDRILNLNRINYIEDPNRGFDAGNKYYKQRIKESKEKAEAARIAKAQEAEKETIKTADQHLPNDA